MLYLLNYIFKCEGGKERDGLLNLDNATQARPRYVKNTVLVLITHEIKCSIGEYEMQHIRDITGCFV